MKIYFKKSSMFQPLNFNLRSKRKMLIREKKVWFGLLDFQQTETV